jgi:hypothetical protein
LPRARAGIIASLSGVAFACIAGVRLKSGFLRCSTAKAEQCDEKKAGRGRVLHPQRIYRKAFLEKYLRKIDRP